jgi:CobQ-like glutamine amidotransferase family enzyme
MRPVIDVGVVLPELLDLHGDSGNADVLAARAGWAGVEVRVHAVRDETDARDRVDIWLIGDGADGVIERVADQLHPLVPAIVDSVEATGSLLAVGLGFDLLTGSFELAPRAWRDGAGVFSGRAPLLYARASADLVVTTSRWGTVVGYENHARGYRPGPGEQVWGRLQAGTGNGDESEGVDFDGRLGTHLHGPVLANNPVIADELLDRALRARYDLPFAAVSPQAETADAFADGARRTVIARLGKSAHA